MEKLNILKQFFWSLARNNHSDSWSIFERPYSYSWVDLRSEMLQTVAENERSEWVWKNTSNENENNEEATRTLS